MQLARDLDLPVKIIGAPIVREKDGLAMSSRNAYLSGEERNAAPTLYRVLRDCAARIKRGELPARVLDESGAEIERAGFRLDYLEMRNADTLQKAGITGKGVTIAVLDTGLWTSDRNRPADLARERPRETPPMTVAQLREMGMAVQPLDELAELVVAGIRHDRFLMIMDVDRPGEVLRHRLEKTLALENPTEVHQLG